MPLHDAARLVCGRGEGRAGEPERLQDAVGEKLGIGLMRGRGEGGGEQIEAEIGIEDRRSGREQERIALKPAGEGLWRDVDEGIVRRPRLMRDLARQSGGMGGEIDEPDRPPALRQGRDEVGDVFGQRIGEADYPVGDEARQHLAGEGLGDRPDPQERTGVRRFTRPVGRAAEAVDRRFTVADDAENERGRLERKK